jgi:hypothetical protein
VRFEDKVQGYYFAKRYQCEIASESIICYVVNIILKFKFKIMCRVVVQSSSMNPKLSSLVANLIKSIGPEGVHSKCLQLNYNHFHMPNEGELYCLSIQ